MHLAQLVYDGRLNIGVEDVEEQIWPEFLNQSDF